jgi:sugar-specific transcriptional regulator TrmB
MIESLQMLGLTAYEAKVLVALTKSGSGTATEIHTLSAIPRSAVYGVLTKLGEKGLIEIQNTKPMRYKAIAPDRAMKRLMKDFEAECENARVQMEQIYRTPYEEVVEDLVWNISGVKNVTEKILQLLDSAEEEIFFASSYPSLNRIIKIYPILSDISDIAQQKIKEGVKVRLTGLNSDDFRDAVRDAPGADIRVYGSEERNSPLRGGMMVVDQRELLIIVIGEGTDPPSMTAIWSTGKEVVSIFRHFVELEWEISTPFSSL